MSNYSRPGAGPADTSHGTTAPPSSSQASRPAPTQRRCCRAFSRFVTLGCPSCGRATVPIRRVRPCSMRSFGSRCPSPSEQGAKAGDLVNGTKHRTAVRVACAHPAASAGVRSCTPNGNHTIATTSSTSTTAQGGGVWDGCVGRAVTVLRGPGEK